MPAGLEIRVFSQMVHTYPAGVEGHPQGHGLRGGFTGQPSFFEVIQAGAVGTLSGHSETREAFGITDGDVHNQLEWARLEGLELLPCVGEPQSKRYPDPDRPEYENPFTAVGYVVDQVHTVFDGLVDLDSVQGLTMAYEPIWAIGTGRTATPPQVDQVHTEIRGALVDILGKERAKTVRIQYGGSVKASNAADLYRVGDVDGFLVGTASADPIEFARIAQAVQKVVEEEPGVMAAKEGRKPVVAGNMKNWVDYPGHDLPLVYQDQLVAQGVDTSKVDIILIPTGPRIYEFASQL